MLGGLTFMAPLWETVGIELSVVDSYVRVDSDRLERWLQQRAPPGVEYHLEHQGWTHVARLSAGVKIAY